MIVLYQGRRGAGKTLSMVRDGYKFHLNGMKVYSNIAVQYPHEYISEDDILKIDDKSHINNCVLMVDEIQILLDSRRSMNDENVNFSRFIQQIRKRNIILLGTAQFSNTVDLRLRQHIDILAKPQYYKDYQVVKVTYIDITVIDEFDIYDDKPYSVTIVFDATPIYKLYNTLDIVRVRREKKEKKGRKARINEP